MVVCKNEVQAVSTDRHQTHMHIICEWKVSMVTASRPKESAYLAIGTVQCTSLARTPCIFLFAHAHAQIS